VLEYLISKSRLDMLTTEVKSRLGATMVLIIEMGTAIPSLEHSLATA
jgi:hypothetical protein